MRTLAAAALLLAGAPALAVSEADLRRHIAVLADDAMQGRRPGTPGGDAAAAYIAAQFAAAGLAPGAPGGGWYAPVPLVERKPFAASLVAEIGGKVVPVAAGERALAAAEPAVRLAKARVVFVGHGIEDEALGVHNLAGLDLKGAVVLMLPGKPKGMESAPNTPQRREALFQRGAAAVLLAMRPDDPWPAIRDGIVEGQTTAAGAFLPPVDGALSLPGWGALVGAEQKKLIVDAATKAFRGRVLPATVSLEVRGTVRRYDSWNVVARLAGSEPAAGALLYLAHWDHLGRCGPAGAADRICNGAVDNASGVASLIEIARGVAAGTRPRRDIYFVATTAEEMGLLGARALAVTPPVPRERIAAVVNFDTVAIAPRGEPIGVLGRGMTPLDPLIEQAAKAVGRTVSPSTAANALISRQDGWAFTEAGVPAIMANGALADMPKLGAFFASTYHSASDDLDHGLELGGAAEDADFHIALARLLADPKRYPGR